MPNAVRSVQVTAAQSQASAGDVVKNAGAVAGISVLCEMVGGTGGTSITGYVQTSLDGGVTWFDIMAFQFANTAKQLGAISRNDQAVLTAATLGLFALSAGGAGAGAAINAPLGDQFRFMYTSVGTYSGTTLKFSYSLTY